MRNWTPNGLSLLLLFFFSRHLCIPMVSISDFIKDFLGFEAPHTWCPAAPQPGFGSPTAWDPSSLGKVVVCSVITPANCVITRLFRGYRF